MNEDQDEIIKNVEVSKLVVGPGSNSELSEDAIERIKKFKEVFKEVDTSSLEETILNFKKESRPEDEIKVWEDMALRYAEKMQKNPEITLDEKKKVFVELLMQAPPIRVTEVE